MRALGSFGRDRPEALREQLLGWILRAWQPRSSGYDGTPREVAPDTGHELLDKRLSVRREESSGVPSHHRPTADRFLAMNHRDWADPRLREVRVGRHDGQAVSGRYQGNERVWSAAFQQHPWADLRDTTSRFEPLMRAKTRAEKKKRFLAEVQEIHNGTACQPVPFRHQDQHVHWIEQPTLKSLITRWDMGDLNFAPLQTAGQACTAIFDEMNIDTGIPASILDEKLR
jgi:hypothetical protein